MDFHPCIKARRIQLQRREIEPALFRLAIVAINAMLLEERVKLVRSGMDDGEREQGWQKQTKESHGRDAADEEPKKTKEMRR